MNSAVLRRYPSTAIFLSLAIAVLLAASFWRINVFDLPGLNIVGIEENEVGEVAIAFLMIIPALFVDTAVARRRDHENDAQAERMRGYATVQHERDLARQYLDTADVILLALDLDGRITLVNRKGCDLLGRSEQELRGRDWIETCVPERFRAGVTRTLDALVAGNVSVFENPILTRSGEERLIEWRATRLLDDGRVIGTLKSGTDITGRQAGEEAIRTSDRRYRTLFEYAPDGIVIADKTSYYLDANASICRMLGYTREEFIGLHASDIVVAAEVEHIEPALKAITTTSDYQRQWQFRRKNGSVFPADVIATEMPDGNVLAMIRDVTERQRLERQLQQAQKMEAIGTLAGGIAHDFNNILGAILGFAEMATVDAEGNDAALNSLAEITIAGRRAAALVGQILAFSRRGDDHRQPVRLGGVVAEVLKLLRASLPSSIDIRTTIDPHTPVVLADPTQIHQVVMNLATNAWHAMKDAPGVLDVTLGLFEADAVFARSHVDLPAGRYALLTVRDSGHGMDHATQDRIFDPFFTTKGPGEGTGLGLAMVHGIMKSHHGAITVYSRPGAGTTFHLYFPAIDADVDETVAALAAVPRGRGQRILFVDDEPPLVEWGTRVLERLGYRVAGCGGPAEALDLVRQSPGAFDLVVTDLTMPAMTGVQLAERIHAARPGLPVILTTGNSGSITVEAMRQYGIREVILKPNSVRTLGGAVDRALSPEPA